MKRARPDSNVRPARTPDAPGRQGFTFLPLAFLVAFLAFLFVPRIHANPALVGTFAGTAAALLGWFVILWARARRRGRPLLVELVPPQKSHYIQASVQLSIYAYWGWYWRELYAEAPLILSQLCFLYVFDALLTWSRGRSWRLGCGPLPIILSVNVFIWFRDDWFYWQFALVALCALGKEFIRWKREGKSTHIFNPSAFGLTVVSLVLIVTGATKDYTWARELASTIDQPPHIYLVIFLLGLVVQYAFSVTLMTLSATATLCLLNLIYTGSTDVYQFVTTNISAAVFLGLHLLMTDPATSPRSNAGRVIFGGLYGLGNWVMYDILSAFGAPELYTKLLIVPMLNLAVPWIDRIARDGIVGRLNRAWESALQPRKTNLIHMGCWAGLFFAMWGTGFVEGPHAGNSIAFWKKAQVQGKPRALKNTVLVSLIQANDGSGPANNEIGLFYAEGNELVQRNNAKAARYFGIASSLGDPHGSANVVRQFLYLRERRSEEDLARAFAQLEHGCELGQDPLGCYLVGFAYESGRGRPLDKRHALGCYMSCGRDNLLAAKGIARIALAGGGTTSSLGEVAKLLEMSCEAGDAESCWYLAYLCHAGIGVPSDEGKAHGLLERACKLGSQDACKALQRPVLPPYTEPVLAIPGWSTAFPVR